MKKHQHSAAVAAEIARIESIITEHGPSTAYFIGQKMNVSRRVTELRLCAMRAEKRAHVTFKDFDPLTKSNTPSAHYILGPDPERGIQPFRPVRTVWSNVKANSDPLHAHFWGQAA